MTHPSGREKHHDVHRDVSVMRTCWVSQAAGRQRAGRAGRVRAGMCFRLYPRHVHSHVMRDHSTLPPSLFARLRGKSER